MRVIRNLKPAPVLSLLLSMLLVAGCSARTGVERHKVSGVADTLVAAISNLYDTLKAEVDPILGPLSP
jgi:outer membrane murein-binding lipoprotein Lpp